MLACRPMLCFAIAVMAGSAAARTVPEAAAWVPAGLLLFLALCLLFLFLPPAPPAPAPELPAGYDRFILARPGFLARRGLNRAMLLFCFGIFLACFPRAGAWQARLSPDRLPENRWFDAVFTALEPSRVHSGEEGVWRAAALLLTADGRDMGGYPIRLSGPDGESFRRGDLIQCRVRRDADPVRAYPGAFDLGLWLERDGLGASMAVAALPGSRRTERPAYTVTALDNVSFLTHARRAVDRVRSGAVRLTLEHGGEYGGVLAAMLYGYRKDLSTEMRDSFRRVGIGHVLAISGLHVGLVVWLLWKLSGLLRWSARARAAACLVLAVFYLGLSGGQVAASRATLMAVIHLAGIACGRRGDMLNSLGAAAFFLTVANPSAPFDVSFQLSFTAVVFIYIGLHREPRLRKKPAALLAPKSRFRQRAAAELSSLVRLSIATWAGLFPIIAYVFNQVNLVGLPINIFVIPLMSFVLAGGLLLPVLGWVPGAPFILTLPSRLLDWSAAFADSLPYSSFPAHAPGGMWTAAFYILVFLFLLRGMLQSRSAKRRWTAVTAAAMALTFAGMVSSMHSLPPPEGGRIAVLPGRGFGVVSIEPESGGIVLVGTFARGGLNEAGWLHFLKRGGPVTVVSLGSAEEEDLSALAWHNPLASFTAVPLTVKENTERAGWMPVPGVSGAEYAVSRDSRGRAVWIAARCGGKTVTVSPRLAVRQLTWRLEAGTPGGDADVFFLGFTDKMPVLEAGQLPAGRVFLSGRSGGGMPAGWTDRKRYGTAVFAETLCAYDGRHWQIL